MICFKSQVQEDRYGITAAVREKETQSALWWLGELSWQQSHIRDSDPAPEGKLLDLCQMLAVTYDPQRVFAPYVEVDGHEQHNMVAQLALDHFGSNVYTPYLTYRRGFEGRTRGREIAFEPSWVWSKMRALCCYRSQIELANTRPWFMDDTLREYAP